MRSRVPGLVLSIGLLVPLGAGSESWERCVERARTTAEPWAARDGFRCPADGRVEWLATGCHEQAQPTIEVRCMRPLATGGVYSFHLIQWYASGQRVTEDIARISCPWS